MADIPVENDSQGGRGWIPGAPGIPAFVLRASEPSAIPVLIAVPHGGRAYPRALLCDMRNSESVALRLEDRYADRLAQGIARETGARSEEHTSELQSLMRISYAVFCLKKKHKIK